MPPTTILLSGGGARGAYQAGVLKGLAEIWGRDSLPFPVITGMSAGALNATFIASRADRFQAAAQELAHLWSGLHSHEIYKTRAISFSRLAFRVISDLALSGLKDYRLAKALLDTSPLRELVERQIDFTAIRRHLDSGRLQVCEVSAFDYLTMENVSFYISEKRLEPWRRVRRRAAAADITAAHVLASSAIPLFFPPVAVNGRWYGDGCLRNTNPLSPAIRFGADRILIIGVRKTRKIDDTQARTEPNLGRVLGVLLNSVFMDSVDEDLERLRSFNELAAQGGQLSGRPLAHVETLYLNPSQDLGRLAAELEADLPPTLRYLLKGLGTKPEIAELISYLMFEPQYCTQMVRLGYQDTIARRAEISSFLGATTSTQPS